MATENPFPLNIVTKQDTWEKLQILQHVDPMFKYDAEEYNKIKQALDYLYENIVGAVPSTTPGYELKYFGAGAVSITVGPETSMAEMLTHMNSIGFTVTAGRLIKLAIIVLRKINGNNAWVEYYYNFKRNNTAGNYGTAAGNPVVSDDLIISHDRLIKTFQGNEVSHFFNVGDISSSSIED